MTLFALSLFGCADNNCDEQCIRDILENVEPPPAPDLPIPTDTNDPGSTETETEPECGFTHHTFPNEGKTTTTLVTFRLVGPSEISRTAGSPITYVLELSNEDCGWAYVTAVNFAVSAWGNGPWIESVEDDAIPMEMRVSNGASYFNEGYNIIEPYGEQLFYAFTSYGSDIHTEIEPIWLPPGESELVTFTFTSTEGLNWGDTFSINSTNVHWTDFESGNPISDTPWTDTELLVNVL